MTDFVLQLTSPHMKGHNVRLAQGALNRNRFGDFLQGTPIDGDYGVMTAQATHRAKYWLGFRKGIVNQVYGPGLHSILLGDKLTLAMRIRRRFRLRHKNDVPKREKALAKAVSQIGISEHPYGSNHVKYNLWYYDRDIRVPWCAIFVTWCWEQVGSSSFRKGSRYSYVPSIVSDARAGRNNLSITRHPQKGDLVCYDWEHNGEADHIGFFSHWNDSSHIGFTAIEGNTAAGNNSNGGQVQRRPDRLVGEVIAFVHVGG